MFDRSLFERLEESASAGGTVHERGSISRYQTSVLENVQRVLNARQGCCETRPDYGMPDLNDMIGHGADAVLGIAHAVKQQIDMFEPRLTNVLVRYVPDPDNPLQLSFHISADLQFGGESERISFDTILSDDKRVRIRG